MLQDTRSIYKSQWYFYILKKKNWKLKQKTSTINNNINKHETFRDKHKKCARYFYEKGQNITGTPKTYINRELDLVHGLKDSIFLRYQFMQN